MLVSSIVRRNADMWPDRDAVVEPGRQVLSWGALEERTNRLARGLRQLGVDHGDRLGVLAPNCSEHLELFFAEAKSGMVGAPMNIRLTHDDLAAYCRYVEPTALVVHASLAETARALAAEVPGITTVVGFGGDHGCDVDLDQLADAQDAADPGYDVADTDLYQLAATSGTTGVSKAVALTHRNCWAAICWAKSMACMPCTRPSSHPTSWALAICSSDEVGVASPLHGSARRPSSSRRSGDRADPSSPTDRS